MGKVHYSVLNDMEKYNKKFNRKYFEHMEEEKVHEVFKKWYSKNLPIDLSTWCKVNEPSDKMLYKKEYWEQIVFFRDIINRLFYDYIQLPIA